MGFFYVIEKNDKTVMKQPLLFLALLALLQSCKKDDSQDAPQPQLVPNPIRFDALAIGQVSHYLCLNGHQYHPAIVNSPFEYTDDTLRLEIVAKDANGYKVAETLRYVGAVNDWIDSQMDSTYYYYLRVSDDTLRFIPIGSPHVRSRIVAFHAGRLGLPLQKIESPQVDIKDWRTTFPSGADRWEGYTENYTLFGKTYDHLNVIVENSSMAFDGNGETYVFSKNHGIVRSSTYSWWTQSGYGWDLLPNE